MDSAEATVGFINYMFLMGLRSGQRVMSRADLPALMGPMPWIARYILAQLVTATIFVTLALTFAIWLTQSLRLIDYIVNRGLPASTFLTFVGLLLPSFPGLVIDRKSVV